MTDVEKSIENLEKKGRCYFTHDYVDSTGSDHTLLFQSPPNQEIFGIFSEIQHELSAGVYQHSKMLKLLNSCLVGNLQQFRKFCDEDYTLPQQLIEPLLRIIGEQQERLDRIRKKA